MDKLLLEYQKITKIYLNHTYIPTYLCDSNYSCDSSDHSKEEEKKRFHQKHFSPKLFLTKQLRLFKKKIKPCLYNNKKISSPKKIKLSKKNSNSNCEKNKKTHVLTKLENLNCDNSTTQIKTK